MHEYYLIHSLESFVSTVPFFEDYIHVLCQHKLVPADLNEQLFGDPSVLHSVFSFNYLAYVLILENDSNAEVRRAVLSCIAMSPCTLPKVIKRTRDIKENVRRLAYQVGKLNTVV